MRRQIYDSADLDTQPMVIAIDGPAGAGKSTTARLVAERLGFTYVDTGAMYRVITWIALRDQIDLDDGVALGKASEQHEWDVDHGRVRVDGEDVTSALREPRVDRDVSRVAAHAEVRAVLRERQRAAAARGNAVIEGRDIATVVAPDAAVKVYLTADEDERARRRAAEHVGGDKETLVGELRRRDEADAEQSRLASDATKIDTTGLEIDEVVERILRLAGSVVAARR
jgi:cytidylate kinase